MFFDVSYGISIVTRRNLKIRLVLLRSELLFSTEYLANFDSYDVFHLVEFSSLMKLDDSVNCAH